MYGLARGMHLEAGFDWSVMCRLLAHSVSYCGTATCPELGANRK